MKPARLSAFLRRSLFFAALTTLSSSQAWADTWYWDVNSTTTGPQQGAGTWGVSNATWWNGTATVNWNNSAGHVAHFGTATGDGITGDGDALRTISIADPVNAAGLIFNATNLASYILTGGEIILPNNATIDVRGSNGTDAGTRRHRIHSVISGSNIKITRSTTTSLAMLRLFGSNAWTGTLSLSASSGEGIFVEALNGPAINTLSSISVGDNSSMILASSQTYTPSFSISGSGSGGNRGAIRFDVNGGTVTGPITLNGNATINALAGVTGTVSGPIDQVNSGRTLTLNPNGGTLVFNANNDFKGPVTISSGSLILNGNNTISGTISVGANSIALLGENQFVGSGKIVLSGGSITLGKLTSAKAAPSPALNPIELAAGTNNTITAVVGPGGFTLEEFGNLPNYPTSGTGTAAFGMSALTDIYWNGALSGTRAFAKGGLGTLTLLGTRTDSGGVIIREGSLRFFHIADGGQPSSIGTSSSAAASLLLSGGRLAYEGPQAQTNRLFTLTASSTIDASGSGPLHFSNLGSIANVGTSARTLTLTGYAPGESKISSIIPNAGTGAVSITKRGTGAWNLAGTNTHTGTTRVDGGSLILDYSAGKDPISTGPVHLNAGELRIKGTTAGTTEIFSTFQLATNQHASSVLKFENRVNLTMSTLTGAGQSQRIDLFDISSNSNNSLAVTALGTPLKVVNGVLLANTASADANGRANMILKDKDGTYGFPTLSGGTTGNLVKISPNVNYTSGGTAVLDSNATNYRFTKGEYSASGPLDTSTGSWMNMLFHTLTFDSKAASYSSGNAITLSLSGGRLSPTGSGKGILMTGNNDVTISNFSSSNSNTQPLWLHNYLEPPAIFKIEANFDQQFLMFGGTGFTEHVGNFRETDNFFLFGSTVRVSKSQFLASNEGNFRVSTGGVLEINARLFNMGGDAQWGQVEFAKPVRVTPDGGIAFYGDSGISAYRVGGGSRIVDFAFDDLAAGKPISQDLTWGAGRFLTQPNTEEDGDYTFKLSSANSNALLQLRNNINLNGRNRNIEVAQGTAPVDALLSGVLSGSDASGIIKSGAGTLQLTGQNTFKGETRIQEGKLMAGTGNLHAASTITLITTGSGGSGELEITSDLSVASVTINGVPQGPGKVTHASITGAGSLYVGGSLTPYQQWANTNGLLSGESAGDFDADFDGVKNGIEYAVGTNPKASTPSVLSQVSGSPASVRFNRATSPARTDLNLFLESSADLSGSWTVLATSTGGATMVSSVGVSATVSEASGTVTVTDNRTHATGKVFYRLRAEIP